jgi:AcrR family transcriptional regulator
MAATGQAPRRKDAQRNRAAILDAARELFAESTDVPLYEVARRAGVGQATLYRNFPDRAALAAALIGEMLEGNERIAEEHAGDPDGFFILLRTIAANVTRFHTLSDLAQQDRCAGSALEAHRRRFRELIKRALHDAKAAGLVRRDLTVDDVFLVLAMVRGASQQLDGPAARAAAASRALSLVLDGITA